MRRVVLWIIGLALAAGVAAAGAIGGGAAIAGPSAPGGGAADEDDSNADTPLSGSVLDRAVAAAIAHTGGGTVTETEAGDDGAAYGVEIRKPDGNHVEVNLDQNFAVIGDEIDDD